MARRPKTRAGCMNRPGACPFMTCRYNTVIDVGATGELVLEGERVAQHRYVGDEELERLADVAVGRILAENRPTCSLDIADEGEANLQEIADALGGQSRERMRQLETRGLAKLRKLLPESAADAIGLDAPHDPWTYTESVDSGDVSELQRALEAFKRRERGEAPMPVNRGGRATLLEMIGRRFGRLVVVERTPPGPGRSGVFWLVQCDCGVKKAVRGMNLRQGVTKSCGCLLKENGRKKRKNDDELNEEAKPQS